MDKKIDHTLDRLDLVAGDDKEIAEKLKVIGALHKELGVLCAKRTTHTGQARKAVEGAKKVAQEE